MGEIIRAGRVMRQRAQHPADCVAQLAIGFDEGFEDLRSDAQIVGVIRGADPQAQNIGAGIGDDLLRRDHIAERFRHFAALLIQHEAVSENRVIGRAVARAAGFQQRGMEPAAMLVRAFEIHDLVGAAIALAMNSSETRESLGVFEHEGVGAARIKPHVEHVGDFFVFAPDCGRARGNARRRPPRTRRRRPPWRRPPRCARSRARRSAAHACPS